MTPRSVVYAPEALDDLIALYDWVSERAGANAALSYTEKLEQYCNKLDLASERGTLREDIRAGLRVVGFNRSASIAFVVEEKQVVILRIFLGGQDWEAQLDA